MKETAIYVHIPFCDHKCIYCDFYSIITTDNISSYKVALEKEIDFYSSLYSKESRITSIYFGGGTPSLMEPCYLNEIINRIKKKFTVSDNPEITMETNPGTVNKEKLKDFLNSGINRISIGIQSFKEEELKFLTRIHDKATAINTVMNASEVGFKNISVDLIFNLPGQSKETWTNNLKIAASLPIQHISAYSLILEKGTILNKMVLDGKVILQEDDYDADLYEITIDYLEQKGFLQYEVSNFARPGYECLHNNAYWRYRNYLGLGTSAHSFINNKRWWNFSSLKMYNASIESKGSAEASHEFISQENNIDEYIMLAMRSYGIDLCDLEMKFGNKWIERNKKYLKLLSDNNLIINRNNWIKLTKRGYAICDEIIAKFL
ncbi:MAG: radical SAM family heme chaperone HemW [Ignavibacteriaceae bacterium]|nr:radical SAM family heme chaperone HemW [Ignavibacteriaceae bacterium]